MYNAHWPHHIKSHRVSHVRQNHEVWNEQQKPNHQEKQIIKTNKYNEMENKTRKNNHKLSTFKHKHIRIGIGVHCTTAHTSLIRINRIKVPVSKHSNERLKKKIYKKSINKSERV